MLRQNVESFVACNMAAAIGEKVHRNCNIFAWKGVSLQSRLRANNGLEFLIEQRVSVLY